MGFINRTQRFTGSNYLDVDSPLKKYQKLISKSLHFEGGQGGGQGQFGKSLHVPFFCTLPLLSSGTQKALLDMTLNIHLIKRQNQTFID